MKPQIDPVSERDELARVRAARHRISERFGHDPRRLVAYYIERQREHADRLISAPELEVAAEPAGHDGR